MYKRHSKTHVPQQKFRRLPIVSARSKDEGLRSIIGAVRRFERNLEHYKSKSFDETSTREQFINPLFEALGWDVLDEDGRGPHRDVVFHRRLVAPSSAAGLAEWDDDLSAAELSSQEPSVTVPDYEFRINGRTRFFVEAKKPSVEIRRKGPSFQVKSYAWSQRLPFAVLTDFEEFRLFNCTTRPEFDLPDAGLVSGYDLSFREYADNWDRLWETLSREAVEGGSLDSLQLPTTPRGAIPVDDSFLADLERWRSKLAQDIATRNVGLTAWQVAEATQRILDRLVFLRVCEDRTLEPDVVLRKYARITDAYHALRPQFRRLDSVYNGALFREHFSETLEISDGVFQHIIASLYFPAPYRFDAISVDLLGAIYERFLGREITLREGVVQLDEKPEVRHAGGVYYTPRWIVDRIIEQTVGRLIKNRPKQATPRALANLRIVDPACGSGSFLIGAFEYLIEWHERYYSENPNEAVEKHYEVSPGVRRLTTDAKAEIAATCLFGVDIDPQAVEVAQMSLYLKILEEETSSSIARQTRLFHRALLPNLSRNIRSGNSLLSTHQVEQTLLYEESLRRRINPFDWEDATWGFGEVFTQHGGFDAVIGNPPYTRVQVMRKHRPEESSAYTRHYEAAKTGSWDIASLFVEKGLSLLRPATKNNRGGYLGFIISRQFVETDAGRYVRELLCVDRHVSEITDFGTGLVFPGVNAYTVLLVATAGANASYTLTRVTPPPTSAALADAERPGSLLTGRLQAKSLTEDAWSLSLPQESALLERLADRNATLKEVCGDVIFQGVITGLDSVFRAVDVGPDPNIQGCRLVQPQIHSADDPPVSIEKYLLQPVLAGRSDFRRFAVSPSREWIIMPYERAEKDRYSLISSRRLKNDFPHGWEWLTRYRQELEARAGNWNDENWYSFSRRQNLERFGEPKILVPYMVEDLCAHYDNGGHYFVNVSTGGYGLGLDPSGEVLPEYLAALLNSELLSWVLRRFSRVFQGGWYGARKANLARLPIHRGDIGTQQRIIALYEHCKKLVPAKKAREDASSQIVTRLYEAAAREFDNAIYDLYEVTESERKLVRSGLPLNVQPAST